MRMASVPQRLRAAITSNPPKTAGRAAVAASINPATQRKLDMPIPK